MGIGMRFGVVIGLAAGSVLVSLMHGIRPVVLGESSWWTPVLPLVAAWVALEVAGLARRRLPWLGRGFLLLGAGAAGCWWLWLYQFLGEGQAPTHLRIGIPSVLAVAYVGALMLGTWFHARNTRARQPTGETELVSQ